MKGAVIENVDGPARRTAWLVTSAVAAVIVYVTMWVGYRLNWAPNDAVDSWALRTLHGYGVRHPAWVRGWDVLCTVLGPDAFRLAGAAVIALAAVQRNVRAVLFVIVGVEFSGTVTRLAKAAADRPRPASALVYAPSTAFPSGHALETMVGVLVLLTLVAGVLTRAWRIAAIVAGTLIVIAVGSGRVVLNVHHPTDVLAGWALGYLWFCGCLIAFRPPPLRRSGDAAEIDAPADIRPRKHRGRAAQTSISAERRSSARDRI